MLVRRSGFVPFRVLRALQIVSCALPLCINHVRAAQRRAGGTTPGAFVAACRVQPNDRYFQGASILALVHEIGTTSSILYQVSDEGPVPFAELHHESSETSEFMEAQGGVQSTAIASDVLAFLRTKPFFLVKEWSTVLTSKKHPITMPCNIRYVTTDRYNQGPRE